MTGWLLDTLVWTAALIALVLVLRRPVARWFGPQVAYALWAAPLLRLAMPPLTLPAWMAPAQTGAAPASAPEAGNELIVQVSEASASAADASAPATVASAWPFAVLDVALALWLVGVAVFLTIRFRAYWQMRCEMLSEAREVGRAGRVRLVETPSTNAPLAFGVFDKVIALPIGFLALWDRTARDLALEHELAHHRGHDLLINMAVQPLFALHWWNPLGHIAWMAMRRDQEAACDARVVASAPPEVRATYARVIASFAAGPTVALAAPMACPVLGEKSIIHRLRSLNMSERSTRRRMAGRGLLAAALAALPLTATISYAEPARDAHQAPVSPLAPVAPQAPDAPPAPHAPSVPEAPRAWDEEVVISAESPAEGKPGAPEKRKVRKIVIRDGAGKLTPEEHEAMRRDLREAMHEMEVEMEEARKQMRLAFRDMQAARKEIATIEFSCEGDPESTASAAATGPRKVTVCKSQIMASALNGLKSARDSIAADTSMSEEIRAEVLRSLDEEIRKWNDTAG